MTLVDPLSSLARARASVLRTSTAERVADAVREEVVEGRLRPGGRLPEQALCEALGVSRNTVREALSQLVTERVLAREPNRGVFVAEPDADAVRDVYRVRRLLETAAVRDGEAWGPEAVTRVRAAVDEGRAAAGRDDWDAVASANQHFHRALVGLGGSPRLDQQMKLLLAEMRDRRSRGRPLGQCRRLRRRWQRRLRRSPHAPLFGSTSRTIPPVVGTFFQCPPCQDVRN